MTALLSNLASVKHPGAASANSEAPVLSAAKPAAEVLLQNKAGVPAYSQLALKQAAQSASDTLVASMVQALVDDRRANGGVFGTDAARAIAFKKLTENVPELPSLEALHADSAPLAQAALGGLAGKVGRNALAAALEANPDKAYVTLAGPIGAGKSTLAQNLSGIGLAHLQDAIVFETAAQSADDMKKYVLSEADRHNPPREVHAIGIWTTPEICAERMVRRINLAHAENPAECLAFPAFLKGSYQRSQLNFREWTQLPQASAEGTNFHLHFFDVSAESPKAVPVGELEQHMPYYKPEQIASVTPQVALRTIDALEAEQGDKRWLRVALGL